ncbi:MAG: hypothetical protein IPH62_17460 [Ignavibacteriae bacterium]|nr:hypothetical protein [Ignavibacteriota bacterium]
MFNSREEFIKVIVEKVLAKLFGNIENNLNSFESGNENWDFINKLFTFSDAEFAKLNKFKKVLASKKTIITPLAYDFLKVNNIKIVYSDEKNVSKANEIIGKVKTNKIAILANFNDESYKNKTKEILLKLGIECESLAPANINFYEFQNSLDELSDKVENNFYGSAIIISNDAFRLRKRLQNLKNLNGQICWEIDNSKVCSVKSKYLFINSSLIGFKMLEQKIISWVNFNKN